MYEDKAEATRYDRRAFQMSPSISLRRRRERLLTPVAWGSTAMSLPAKLRARCHCSQRVRSCLSFGASLTRSTCLLHCYTMAMLQDTGVCL